MAAKRCNHCELLHEQWSDEIIEPSSDDNSISSLQQDHVKQESSRCPRCRLLHSFVCVSFDGSDSEMADSFHSHDYLDDTVEWNTFLFQAHGTKNLDWICSWAQSHKVLHELSHTDIPMKHPATLVSCALQVLDEAGHLEFNIQDPCSLEVALTRIGAIDQIPVQELSMGPSKQYKRVSFSVSEVDGGSDGSDTSCDNKSYPLKEILECAFTSLSPMQTLALDVLFDTDPVDWLNNSLITNFESAFSNMSPLQSLAVAVKAGYVDENNLPEFVDSNFILKNTKNSKFKQ